MVLIDVIRRLLVDELKGKVHSKINIFIIYASSISIHFHYMVERAKARDYMLTIFNHCILSGKRQILLFSIFIFG